MKKFPALSLLFACLFLLRSGSLETSEATCGEGGGHPVLECAARGPGAFYVRTSGPAVLGIIDEPKENFILPPALYPAGESILKLPRELSPQAGRFWLCLFAPGLELESVAGGLGSRGARFCQPVSLCADPVKKEILVVDAGNDRIVRLDLDFNFLDSFGAFAVHQGGGDEQDGALAEPRDLVLGFNRAMVLTDFLNNTIKEFNEWGSFRRVLYPPRSNTASLAGPTGLTRNRGYQYYFVDSGHNRVIKIDRLGGRLSALGRYGGGEEDLQAPRDCAIDALENLHVLDSGRGGCLVWNRFDTFIDFYPVPGDVLRLEFDATGFAWVLTRKSVLLLDANRRVILVREDPKWREPADLCCLADRFLFIIDRATHEIRRYGFSWNARKLFPLARE